MTSVAPRKPKNKSLTSIFAVAAAVVGFLGLVAAFNYSVDPMCYYRCDSIDLGRKTQNVYYRSAQTAAANPDAQVLIVGSSRGERVSPHWVKEVTGLKAINLSQGGAEVFLKVALLNIALEKNPNIKKVIWMADYFELVPSSTDIKVRVTPVLRKYSGLQAEQGLYAGFFERLQGLIDHRTLEAGLEMTGKNYNETFNKQGNGDEIDYKKCLSQDFIGPTPPEMMPKKISEGYAVFGHFFGVQQSPLYWQAFEGMIQNLAQRGIEVIINLAPYHHEPMARAFKEISDANTNQQNWVDRIEKLRGPHVKILHYENGIPGDDGGPRYWEDGAHPTCFAVMQMLQPGLTLSSQ